LYSNASNAWIRSVLGSAGAQLGLGESWAQLFSAGIVIGLMAIMIRLMDDFLDEWVDELRGIKTVGAQLGSATLPYCLALFTVSAALLSKLTIVLFLAAYGVGMANDLHRRLPTGLKGRHEALLALTFGTLTQGIAAMLWAFSLMLALQCGDDFLDYYQDKRVGNYNLSQRIGRVETVLLTGCSLILSLMLGPFLTICALLAVGAVHILLPHVRLENERQVFTARGKDDDR
jgi:1,4-dihydroxy-2-naphthoate octaprenyltransferase